MAGARNTNRRLQQILLRGVVFPAAAAGAIILGASAASAEDGPVSGSLQETTSAVQSTTGGTTDGAPALTEAQPEAIEVDPVTAPDPATVSAAVSEPASDPAPAPTTSEPLRVAEAPVEDATAATTEAAKNPTTVVEKSAPDTLSQSTQQAATTTQQSPVRDLGETTRQVTDLPTEPTATTQSELTDSVGAVADQAAATLDSVAAPVERVGDAGDTAAQADTLVREVSGTATQSVEGVIDTAPALDPTAESTPIFDDLRREIIEPVAATTSDMTDGALAPVTETTPIFDGVRQEILEPVVQTAPVVDGITTPLLAPLTGTVPTIDGITTPLLAPLTGTVPTIDGITTPLLAAAQSTVDGLPAASGALSPIALPHQGVVHDLVAPTASACVTDQIGSSLTSSCIEGTVRGDAADSFLPVEHGLVTAELMKAVDGFLGMVDTLAEGLWFASEDAASSTSTSGATEPADPFSIPRPLFPEGAPVLGGTSLLGSGSQGQSGPIFLLLLAVVGAFVLLRNGGMSQLAIGTSTMLSGRAAVVQDRPG